MKQIVELLKLGEAGTSVEEVIGEFNQLGVGALDKELAGVVGPAAGSDRRGKGRWVGRLLRRGQGHPWLGGGWRTT